MIIIIIIIIIIDNMLKTTKSTGWFNPHSNRYVKGKQHVDCCTAQIKYIIKIIIQYICLCTEYTNIAETYTNLLSIRYQTIKFIGI